VSSSFLLRRLRLIDSTMRRNPESVAECTTGPLSFPSVRCCLVCSFLALCCIELIELLLSVAFFIWACFVAGTFHLTRSNGESGMLPTVFHLQPLKFRSYFPHIINLACQAVVKAIANIPYISNGGDGQFVPKSSPEVLSHDPVACMRAFIKSVSLIRFANKLNLNQYTGQCRSSALRREFFQKCVRENHNGADYQLLRDVETRWSSTLLMIERVLLLRKVYVV
jgi:hypothetical protein